ncbi:MAG: ATPase, T2SS/T4P/T4SS family [Anaerosomatales bacterium]|nr:ATPase, T2SS/T4P/T4SS family [Anaerosomatales bacterium]
MVEVASIGRRVLDALVSMAVLTPEQVAAADERARMSGADSAGRWLCDHGVIAPDQIALALERELGVPHVDLSSYSPDESALALVPAERARAYSVLPMFEIDRILTVAVGDPAGVFALDSLGAELGLELEAVLVDPGSLAQALATYYEPARDGTPADPAGAPEIPSASPALEEGLVQPASGAGTPETGSLIAEPAPEGMFHTDRDAAEPEGKPTPDVSNSAIDLDVLAVADAGKVAVLVSDIVTDALDRGASAIHLLPYKDDFFLVYRIGGRLEQVASAPLSMQAGLVDGFKSYVRAGAIRGAGPALGRLRTRIGERELVLTLSAVATVAGHRLVVSLGSDPGSPRDLPALGVSEAETRALHAMVERGRGILLVCAPVAGGRSATYYALLAHAAAVGKSVYSVEHSIDYEIPAVAQVLVDPGSPVGAASYLAVGARQDTDVVAIDSMQSVEDVHRAIEAAALGKLVIATFSGAGIVAGVSRMLDLGAEPTSLAAALTFGVGQRLVRTTCPDCSAEEHSTLAARIPGGVPGMVSLAGSGCSSCDGSGFGGVTGVFEVLPFTEPVRAAIAGGAQAARLAERAQAAGMRPMLASGLVKVEQGLVSAEELNRVLRFAE